MDLNGSAIAVTNSVDSAGAMSDQHAVNIPECKSILKNGELSGLFDEYISLKTLHFCTSTHDKLQNKVRELQLIALRCFKEEDKVEKGEGKCARTTLVELRELIIKFGEELKSVHKQECSVLVKLDQHKRKVDKKLKSIKTWRKVSIITFASAFAAILIGSVVATAMAAPQRVAAALAAAAAIPVPLMGKWFDSLWKKYEDALKGEEELISAMKRGTRIAINELASILVKQPEIIQIDAIILAVADHVALTDHEAVKIGVGDIKRKLGNFMNIIEDLGKQVDRCTGNVMKARTDVLQKIKNN